MKINSMIFEGKDYEKALIRAEDHFNLSEEDMVIEIVEETEGSVSIKVSPISYVSVYAEEFIRKMIDFIGIKDYTINSNYTNGIVIVDIDSNNNGVLIGKNGQTLNSIIHLTTIAVRSQVGEYTKVNVNIGNYKDIRVMQLENLARSISRQVAKTKVEAKLDPMNSYERRIIHEYLSNDKFVYTTSEGETPNRYVMIKLK